jgi:hypothetical protein
MSNDRYSRLNIDFGIYGEFPKLKNQSFKSNVKLFENKQMSALTEKALSPAQVFVRLSLF